MGLSRADLTVACVLRSGGIYEARHVAGLAAQVEHWLPGARFACLSDMPVPCERVPLQHGWPGWWAKVELFQHFRGPTLYLDLDTVIVADPAPLVTGRFSMIRNWVYPELLAGGVMSWCGDHSAITQAFGLVAQQVMASYTTRERWGDQAFIAEQAALAGPVETFDAGAVVSYRYHHLARALRPPKSARIVAFNAVCPPWDARQHWAHRWWSPELRAAA